MVFGPVFHAGHQGVILGLRDACKAQRIPNHNVSILDQIFVGVIIQRILVFFDCLRWIRAGSVQFTVAVRRDPEMVKGET